MTAVSIDETRTRDDVFAAGVQFGGLVARMEADQRRVLESDIHASTYNALLEVADRLGWRIESPADAGTRTDEFHIRAIRLMGTMN